MNDSDQSKNVVLIAALLVFGLGWFNSEKEGKAPSAKFLIGAGITFTLLSFLSDFSPAAANALALAIATTALFGEGGGVLTYLNKEGDLDTPTNADAKDAQDTRTAKKGAAPIQKQASSPAINNPGLPLTQPTLSPNP
jgi:hypothetical protein